jgi:hypothetical protein
MGEILDKKFLKKFETKPQVLSFFDELDFQYEERGRNLFLKLSEHKLEADRLRTRYEIMIWFKDIYWYGDKSGSIVTLMNVMGSVFFTFDDQVKEEILEQSYELFQRSAVCASYSVIAAMAIGYNEFKVLQDIFNLCFFYDVGVPSEEKTMNYFKLLELERENPGSGIAEFASNPHLKRLVDVYKNRGELSFKFVSDKYKSYFNYPFMINFLRLIGERLDGKGHPSGLDENDLMELDCALLLVNGLISYKQPKFSFEDGRLYINKKLRMHSYSGFEFRMKHFLIEMFDKLPRAMSHSEGAA